MISSADIFCSLTFSAWPIQTKSAKLEVEKEQKKTCVFFSRPKKNQMISSVTYKRLCCGVRSLCRRFLNQFDTWVSVRPVFFASNFFSSGVGYLRMVLVKKEGNNK